VARGGELDGRRPSALGHESLQGRVDGPVVARNCVPRRERVPGARPGWSTEEGQARGVLLGCDLSAQLRIQILGEVIGEELRVDDEEGERRGGHQMSQKRPRRVANAQAGDRLAVVWDVRRRIDQSADIAAPAGGVGDHEPAVRVSDQDLVSRDRIQRRPHDRHVVRHRRQAERRGRRLVAVLVQRGGNSVPSGRRCEGAVHEHDRRRRVRLGRSRADGES
jgi:hypothetical protein